MESPEHQAALTALWSRGRTWNPGPCPVEKSLVSQHIPVSDRLGTGWRGKPRALGTATRAGVLLPLDGLELLQWSGYFSILTANVPPDAQILVPRNCSSSPLCPYPQHSRQWCYWSLAIPVPFPASFPNPGWVCRRCWLHPLLVSSGGRRGPLRPPCPPYPACPPVLPPAGTGAPCGCSAPSSPSMASVLQRWL